MDGPIEEKERQGDGAGLVQVLPLPTTEVVLEPYRPVKVTWHKAKSPRLMPSITTEEAFAAIIASGLLHLRANEACVVARGHEEGIHQMRVAVRRLRSCLALYRNLIPSEQCDYLNVELRWLIGELGPARDWDVFVAAIFEPVRQAMPAESRLTLLRERVEEMRDQAYARAQAAIQDHRYVGLMMLLDAWADGRRWHQQVPPAAATALRARAIDTAHHLLDERFHDVLTVGNEFASLSAEERHKVRIQVKKLRYAIEFFEALYPKRQVGSYLADLREVQDALGVNNDVEVARNLLKQVVRDAQGGKRARLNYAAGLVIGWHSHVSDDREQHLVARWQKFIAKPCFWSGRDSEARRPKRVSSAASGKATAATSAATGNEAGEELTASSTLRQVALPPDPTPQSVPPTEGSLGQSAYRTRT